MEQDEVPLLFNLLGPQEWTVELEGVLKGKGFARVEVGAPLDFAVLQAGPNNHNTFELSLRINPPSSVASQSAPPSPCGLLVRLYRYFHGRSWEECPFEEAKELKVTPPSASASRSLKQMMKKLRLSDKGSQLVQVNAPGTVNIKFELTQRLKGVYCIGFRLAYEDGSKEDRVALYGPPMTMVANTGGGRAENREALKDIVQHVCSVQSRMQDWVFLAQVINAACNALRGVDAFRDDDDIWQARSLVRPEDDRIKVLTDIAWKVACTFGVTPGGGTSKLVQLWSQTNPKLIEGYLVAFSQLGSSSDAARKMLEGLPPGSFVLRLSDNCAVSISYVSEQGQVEKMGVKYESKEKHFTDFLCAEAPRYPSLGAMLRASTNKLKYLITYVHCEGQEGQWVKERKAVPLDHVLEVCDDEKTPPKKKRFKKEDLLSDYKPVLEACNPLIRDRLESLEAENQRLHALVQSYYVQGRISSCPRCGISSSSTSAATSPYPQQQPYSYQSSPQAPDDTTRGKRAREEEEEESVYLPLPPLAVEHRMQSSPELADSMGGAEGAEEELDLTTYIA